MKSLLTCVALLAATQTLADSPKSSLIEEKKTQLSKDVGELQQAIQERENVLRTLLETEQAKRTHLAALNAQKSMLLGKLMHISRTGTYLLWTQPQKPYEFARASRLIQFLTAKIKKESGEEAENHAAVEAKLRTLDGELDQLKTTQMSMQGKIEGLDTIQAKKNELSTVAAHTDPHSSTAILNQPVEGTIITSFKQNKNGLKRCVFEAALGSIVVAPKGGRVIFSGQSVVKRHGASGKHLIIDHGDGYHTHLTGLETMNVSVGQVVHDNDAVGSLRSFGKTLPRLYMEVRLHNQRLLTPNI